MKGAGMKGYRTFITNGVFIVASVASVFGVLIPQDEQTAVIAGAIALVNIGLRFYTSTPWGRKT